MGSSNSVDVPRALFDFARLGKPGLREHVHHPAVLTADERLEAGHAARPRNLREALEQARAEPAALEIVGDRKRHLRPFRPFGIGVVAGHADQLSAAFRHQDDVTRLIDIHVRAGAGQIEVRRHQETVVEAFGRQTLEKSQRLGRVVRAAKGAA